MLVRSVKAPPPSKQISTEDPDLAERLNRVLAETIQAMDEAKIRYVFIGGIASCGLGRPRSTRDIDLFVMPEDAELALRALAKHGFRTEKTDPSWLYKGFKEDILVDIIFKSKGEIYLDPEMYRRMIIAEYHGKRIRSVAPEDLMIIKAVAHSELTPGHWHDAIALLSHAQIDWEYLIRRARRAPRRVLSLLLYAQSNDIGVPNYVIHRLYQEIFGEGARGRPIQPPLHVAGTGVTQMKSEDIARVGSAPDARAEKMYGLAHLRERFAEDPRTHELDIRIEQEGGRIILEGTVPSRERLSAVESVAREYFPREALESRVRVLEVHEPIADADERGGEKGERKRQGDTGSGSHRGGR